MNVVSNQAKKVVNSLNKYHCSTNKFYNKFNFQIRNSTSFYKSKSTYNNLKSSKLVDLKIVTSNKNCNFSNTSNIDHLNKLNIIRKKSNSIFQSFKTSSICNDFVKPAVTITETKQKMKILNFMPFDYNAVGSLNNSFSKSNGFKFSKINNQLRFFSMSSKKFNSEIFIEDEEPALVMDYSDINEIVNNRKWVLLDVRQPHELRDEGRIPTSVNVPVERLDDALQMDASTFVYHFGFAKPDPQDRILVFCRSGKRSTKAAIILHEHDFNKVYNYKGSWIEWSENHPEDIVSPRNNEDFYVYSKEE